MSTLTKPTRFLDLPSSRVKPELGRGTDVWSFFNPLVFPKAVNLGQGFMNWKPPAFVLDEVLKELHERTDLHHYSHPKGRPRLRAAVQAAYSASFHKPRAEVDLSKGEIAVDDKGFPLQRPDLGVPLDVEREIAVTAGANEAMYSIMCGFLEEGDEVVLFEPFFDQYVCEVSYNGGVPVYVPMLPPKSKERVVSANEWTFDWELLEQKLASPKAKALFLNTPHNPIGKVCTLEELQRLAQLCIKYDILVVSDEVYDCLTYDGHEHIRIASLEGMWERTITVGSAGKTFSCTGWRVGWMIGPPHLIAPAFAAHVRITFSVNSGSQEGAAIGLEQAKANDFFPTQVREYESRRAELLETLDALNFTYTLPHGSYFVLVDASSIQIPADFEFPDEVLKKPRDYHMCWFVAKVCDVVSIPVTAFYSDEGAHVGERYIRFAFCKDNQIVEAGRRLQQYSPRRVCDGTTFERRAKPFAAPSPLTRVSDVFLDAEDESELGHSRAGSRAGRRHSRLGRESSLRRSKSLQRSSIIPDDAAYANQYNDSEAHYTSAAEDARPSSRAAHTSADRQRELANDVVGLPQRSKSTREDKPRRSKRVTDEERSRRHRTESSRRSRAPEDRPRRSRAPEDTPRRRRPVDDSALTQTPKSTRRVRRSKSEAFFDAPLDKGPRRPESRQAPERLQEALPVQERRREPPLREAPRDAPSMISPPMSTSGSAFTGRRLFGGLPFLNRSGTSSGAATPRGPADDVKARLEQDRADAKARAAQEKADTKVRSIQERNEARDRLAREKSEAQSRSMQTKSEAKERVAAAKAEAKEAAARRKAEAKEQAAAAQMQKKEAAEIVRQRKADEKERRATEKKDAKAAIVRQRELQATEAIAASREKERMRELSEMDRKQKRLLSVTPFRRRMGAEVSLTPIQRHGLLKSLVMMQMQQEFLDFGRPGILTQYGFPFASDSSEVQKRRRMQLALFSRKKSDGGAMNKDAVDALHEPLILRHMYQVHLRQFPGLRDASLAFWRKRIQRLNDAFTSCSMSMSRERSEYVLTHMLSLVGTQYLGLFFARGVGVRGPDEERGPGIGEPGSEQWGVGKHWGAGTVKRGLDKPYELNANDLELINSLFRGEDQDVWIAAGRESRRVQKDWAAFKEQIIEQETGMEEIIEYLTVSNVNNLPPHLQNTEEWVRIHVAQVMRWLFVESPAADDLFNFVRVVHMLFPYWPARQILKIANAQIMIQMMLSLLLAQPGGTKSLFQRIVGFVVSRGISSIQREYIEPIRKELNDPALVQKIEAYVRHKSNHETDRMEAESKRTGNDMLTTILLSSTEPRLDAGMRDYVMDLQRAYAASPYRSKPDLAYPSTTPRGKDKPPIPGWGVSVGDASKARMFALLKLLLRESLNKRDREQFSSLLSTSLVPDILRDGLNIVFYDAIHAIASVANMSDRLGDLQKLIEDMINVRKNTDNAPERWTDLANKHHEFIYFFAHECAPVAKPVWEWCQNACDYMSLSTTDPVNPADRSAENIEVNLDEMMQDERLSSADVDGILDEMEQLEQWSRWQKIRRELEFRKTFLLSLTPAASGLWRESLPSTTMKDAVADVDGLMQDLIEAEDIPLDDGKCDAVRGSERGNLPWAFFDKEDPLGQGILAEPDSAEHRVLKPRADVQPPELHHTRKLLPMFRELLVTKLPDWLDADVNGEPIPQPKSLVQSSSKLLKQRSKFLPN